MTIKDEKFMIQIKMELLNELLKTNLHNDFDIMIRIGELQAQLNELNK